MFMENMKFFEVEEKIEIETITKYCKKNDTALPESKKIL